MDEETGGETLGFNVEFKVNQEASFNNLKGALTGMESALKCTLDIGVSEATATRFTGVKAHLSKINNFKFTALKGEITSIGSALVKISSAHTIEVNLGGNAIESLDSLYLKMGDSRTHVESFNINMKGMADNTTVHINSQISAMDRLIAKMAAVSKQKEAMHIAANSANAGTASHISLGPNASPTLLKTKGVSATGADNFHAALDNLKRNANVEFLNLAKNIELTHKLSASVLGEFDKLGKSVKINGGKSAAQMESTLVHELTHAYLDALPNREAFLNKFEKEIKGNSTLQGLKGEVEKKYGDYVHDRYAILEEVMVKAVEKTYTNQDSFRTKVSGTVAQAVKANFSSLPQQRVFQSREDEDERKKHKDLVIAQMNAKKALMANFNAYKEKNGTSNWIHGEPEFNTLRKTLKDAEDNLENNRKALRAKQNTTTEPQLTAKEARAAQQADNISEPATAKIARSAAKDAAAKSPRLPNAERIKGIQTAIDALVGSLDKATPSVMAFGGKIEGFFNHIKGRSGVVRELASEMNELKNTMDKLKVQSPTVHIKLSGAIGNALSGLGNMPAAHAAPGGTPTHSAILDPDSIEANRAKASAIAGYAAKTPGSIMANNGGFQFDESNNLVKEYVVSYGATFYKIKETVNSIGEAEHTVESINKDLKKSVEGLQVTESGSTKLDPYLKKIGEDSKSRIVHMLEGINGTERIIERQIMTASGQLEKQYDLHSIDSAGRTTVKNYGTDLGAAFAGTDVSGRDQRSARIAEKYGQRQQADLSANATKVVSDMRNLQDQVRGGSASFAEAAARIDVEIQKLKDLGDTSVTTATRIRELKQVQNELNQSQRVSERGMRAGLFLNDLDEAGAKSGTYKALNKKPVTSIGRDRDTNMLTRNETNVMQVGKNFIQVTKSFNEEGRVIDVSTKALKNHAEAMKAVNNISGKTRMNMGEMIRHAAGVLISYNLITRSVDLFKEALVSGLEAAAKMDQAQFNLRKVMNIQVQTPGGGPKVDQSEIQKQQTINNLTEKSIQLSKLFGKSREELMEVERDFVSEYQNEGDAVNASIAVTALATVSKMNLAEATKNVVAVSTQYGMSAKQLVSFVDSVTAAHLKLPTVQADQLISNLRAVGPAAHAAGISIDRMVALMAVGMKNFGPSSAQIGNSMKAFFSDLNNSKNQGQLAKLFGMKSAVELNKYTQDQILTKIKETVKAKQELENQDLEKAAKADASGNSEAAKGFRDQAAKIKGDLTAWFSQFGGKVQYAKLIPTFEDDKDYKKVFDDKTGKVRDSKGDAIREASVQLEGLENKYKTTMMSLSTLGLRLGMAVTPAVRSILTQLKELLDKVDDSRAKLQYSFEKAVVWLSPFGSVIKGIFEGLSVPIQVISEAIKSMFDAFGGGNAKIGDMQKSVEGLNSAMRTLGTVIGLATASFLLLKAAGSIKLKVSTIIEQAVSGNKIKLGDGTEFGTQVKVAGTSFIEQVSMAGKVFSAQASGSVVASRAFSGANVAVQEAQAAQALSAERLAAAEAELAIVRQSGTATAIELTAAKTNVTIAEMADAEASNVLDAAIDKLTISEVALMEATGTLTIEEAAAATATDALSLSQGANVVASRGMMAGIVATGAAMFNFLIPLAAVSAAIGVFWLNDQNKKALGNITDNANTSTDTQADIKKAILASDKKISALDNTTGLYGIMKFQGKGTKQGDLEQLARTKESNIERRGPGARLRDIATRLDQASADTQSYIANDYDSIGGETAKEVRQYIHPGDTRNMNLRGLQEHEASIRAEYIAYKGNQDQQNTEADIRKRMDAFSNSTPKISGATEMAANGKKDPKSKTGAGNADENKAIQNAKRRLDDIQAERAANEISTKTQITALKQVSDSNIADLKTTALKLVSSYKLAKPDQDREPIMAKLLKLNEAIRQGYVDQLAAKTKLTEEEIDMSESSIAIQAEMNKLEGDSDKRESNSLNLKKADLDIALQKLNAIYAQNKESVAADLAANKQLAGLRTALALSHDGAEQKRLEYKILALSTDLAARGVDIMKDRVGVAQALAGIEEQYSSSLTEQYKTMTDIASVFSGMATSATGTASSKVVTDSIAMSKLEADHLAGKIKGEDYVVAKLKAQYDLQKSMLDLSDAQQKQRLDLATMNSSPEAKSFIDTTYSAGKAKRDLAIAQGVASATNPGGLTSDQLQAQLIKANADLITARKKVSSGNADAQALGLKLQSTTNIGSNSAIGALGKKIISSVSAENDDIAAKTKNVESLSSAMVAQNDLEAKKAELEIADNERRKAALALDELSIKAREDDNQNLLTYIDSQEKLAQSMGDVSVISQTSFFNQRQQVKEMSKTLELAKVQAKLDSGTLTDPFQKAQAEAEKIKIKLELMDIENTMDPLKKALLDISKKFGDAFKDAFSEAFAKTLAGPDAQKVVDLTLQLRDLSEKGTDLKYQLYQSDRAASHQFVPETAAERTQAEIYDRAISRGKLVRSMNDQQTDLANKQTEYAREVNPLAKFGHEYTLAYQKKSGEANDANFKFIGDNLQEIISNPSKAAELFQNNGKPKLSPEEALKAAGLETATAIKGAVSAFKAEWDANAAPTVEKSLTDAIAATLTSIGELQLKGDTRAKTLTEELTKNVVTPLQAVGLALTNFANVVNKAFAPGGHIMGPLPTDGPYIKHNAKASPNVGGTYGANFNGAGFDPNTTLGANTNNYIVKGTGGIAGMSNPSLLANHQIVATKPGNAPQGADTVGISLGASVQDDVKKGFMAVFSDRAMAGNSEISIKKDSKIAGKNSFNGIQDAVYSFHEKQKAQDTLDGVMAKEKANGAESPNQEGQKRINDFAANYRKKNPRATDDEVNAAAYADYQNNPDMGAGYGNVLYGGADAILGVGAQLENGFTSNNTLEKYTSFAGAAKTAGNFLGTKGIQAGITGLTHMFGSEAVLGKDGKPVLDANGQPTMALTSGSASFLNNLNSPENQMASGIGSAVGTFGSMGIRGLMGQDAGQMTQAEQAGESVGGTAGSMIGGAIGSATPLGPLGTAIGSALGGVIGNFAGGAFGNLFGGSETAAKNADLAKQAEMDKETTDMYNQMYMNSQLQARWQKEELDWQIQASNNAKVNAQMIQATGQDFKSAGELIQQDISFVSASSLISGRFMDVPGMELAARGFANSTNSTVPKPTIAAGAKGAYNIADVNSTMLTAAGSATRNRSAVNTAGWSAANTPAAPKVNNIMPGLATNPDGSYNVPVTLVPNGPLNIPDTHVNVNANVKMPILPEMNGNITVTHNVVSSKPLPGGATLTQTSLYGQGNRGRQ